MNAPESPDQMRQNALPGTALVKFDGCPILFAPKRSWQKFHSDACRMEFHRKKALGPEGRMEDIERQVEALKKGTEELKRRVTKLEGTKTA